MAQKEGSKMNENLKVSPNYGPEVFFFNFWMRCVLHFHFFMRFSGRSNWFKYFWKKSNQKSPEKVVN